MSLCVTGKNIIKCSHIPKTPKPLVCVLPWPWPRIFFSFFPLESQTPILRFVRIAWKSKTKKLLRIESIGKPPLSPSPIQFPTNENVETKFEFALETSSSSSLETVYPVELRFKRLELLQGINLSFYPVCIRGAPLFEILSLWIALSFFPSFFSIEN